MKQILCIKWGTRYGPEYVNRIYAMVKRNITPPFSVICLSDNREGIRPEVIVRDLPPLGCKYPSNSPGKWRKLILWSENLYGIKGVALFVDLDVVITGNLDDFFSFANPDDVILMRNWVVPFERLGQTSVFRFPVGKNRYLLDNFRRDPEAIAGRYRFEQRYVTRKVKGGVKFWPGKWVKHFRMDCLGFWAFRYFRPPRLPRGTRIVIFPSKPDPEDAILGRWSEKLPRGTRWQHIKKTWTKDRVGKTAISHLKKYFLPCPWVAEHWRE